ncbi:MAG: hypothetical protein F4Z55_09750 [Boseongicola sp. SB0667_bin_21]|nr:hypothetical protein [Boseongicola sp. SB0667_bin_21]
MAATQHVTNVCQDKSDWLSKRVPEKLIRFANSVLEEKTPFDSNWTALTPDWRLRGFEAAPFKDEVHPALP